MRDSIEKGILPEGKEAETIDEIIREENIVNHTITIQAGSQKGDNYLGGIYRIIIKGVDSITNDSRELYLILKCSPRVGEFREKFPHNIVFQHESYMYNSYLPKLYAIQQKFGIENGLRKVAKLYKYSTVDMDEFIILEDMKQKGYVMLNRQECLNLQHCKFVMRQLAFLHGYGFVYKHNNPQEFQEISKFMVSPFSQMRPEFRIFMESVADKALGTLDENTSVHKAFFELKKNLHDTMDHLKVIDMQYSIVTHNDCWNNNFLFKYEDVNDSTKPTDVCLLDWQISEVHSPVKDLSYFIYNCTSSELRNTHFNDLLNYYYEQLTEVITDCNCSIDVCYPRTVFDDHVKRFFKHGIIMALITMPLFTSDKEEIPDHFSNDSREENGKENWITSIKSKNDDEYRKRMSSIITHAFENNFI